MTPSGTSHALMQRRQRLARSGGIRPCGICGDLVDMALAPPDPDSFELHHLVPKSMGGSDLMTVVAHRRCNRSAGNRVPPPQNLSDGW